MSSVQNMKENLSGMHWEGTFTFHLPLVASPVQAIRIFKENSAAITWNYLSTFERNPASLPQTESILQGHSVSGISTHDIAQISNYGDGIKTLVDMLAEGSFNLDEKTASALHYHVGHEEALTWGSFRNTAVSIGTIDYIPPDIDSLQELARNGFDFLEKHIESAQERAIATFLFMARSQFFHDANKRTASLMMNGHLLQNSVCPIAILQHEAEAFHAKLTDFYNTGNATEILYFFEHSMQKMYPNKYQIFTENN